MDQHGNSVFFEAAPTSFCLRRCSVTVETVFVRLVLGPAEVLLAGVADRPFGAGEPPLLLAVWACGDHALGRRLSAQLQPERGDRRSNGHACIGTLRVFH